MIMSFSDIRNYNLRDLKSVEDFSWNGSEKPEEYLETRFKRLELKNKKTIFLVTDFMAILFFAVCAVKLMPNILNTICLIVLAVLIMFNIKRLDSKPDLTEGNIIGAIDELKYLIRENKFYSAKDRMEVIELLSIARDRLYADTKFANDFDSLMVEMDIMIISMRTRRDQRYPEVERLRNKLDYRMSECVFSDLKAKLETLKAEDIPCEFTRNDGEVKSKKTDTPNILSFQSLT